MSNDYFIHSDNVVVTGTTAVAGHINNVALAIETGFDKMPSKLELDENRYNYAVATGSANAYVASLPQTLTLTDGMSLVFKAAVANTGATTLNLNSLGAKSIVNADGTSLASGAIVLNQPVAVRYESVNGRYVLMSMSPNVVGLIEANKVITNADVVLTHADVVLAEADKVQTGLDRVATGNDKTATNADVVLTNADVVLAEADKVQTGLDRVATGLDRVATAAITNADVVLTNADVVLTHADVVLTHADVVLAEADKVQTGLDRTAVAADLVLTNQDTIDTAADLVSTNQDTIDTAADLVLTVADVVLTHADVVLTHADVVLAEADKVQTALDRTATGNDKTATNADVVITNADVVLTNADVVLAEAAKAAAELSYDAFDDRFLGAKSSAPSVDNDGAAILTGAMYFNSTTDKMQVWDGSSWIGVSSAISGLTQTFKYVATAGQTAFAGNDANSLSMAFDSQTGMHVFLNGVKLILTTDYTVNTGTNTVTLGAGALSGDLLEVSAFSFFQLSDTYTQAQIDAKDALALPKTGGALTGDVSNTSTGSLQVSQGTTAQRPAGTNTGRLRYNSTEAAFEGYTSAGWGEIGGGGPSLGTDSVIRTNAKVIAENITFAGSENGSSIGPITINSGYTVTVASGSTWVIL